MLSFAHLYPAEYLEPSSCSVNVFDYRVSYVIWVAQCKKKMWGPLFKNRGKVLLELEKYVFLSFSVFPYLSLSVYPTTPSFSLYLMLNLLRYRDSCQCVQTRPCAGEPPRPMAHQLPSTSSCSLLI